jgi:hypothetical protein
MSNRRKISRRDLLAAARCPDCDSEVRYAGRDDRGLHRVEVSHDDSCPEYAKIRRFEAAGLLRLRLYGDGEASP